MWKLFDEREEQKTYIVWPFKMATFKLWWNVNNPKHDELLAMNNILLLSLIKWQQIIVNRRSRRKKPSEISIPLPSLCL